MMKEPMQRPDHFPAPPSAPHGDSHTAERKRKREPATRSKLLRSIQLANPLPLLSFSTWRLSRKRMRESLPEIKQIDERFCDQEAWCNQMEAHNATVRRGVQMGMAPPGCSLSRFLQQHTFDSLDAFLFRMHIPELANMLNGLSAFSERILASIRSGSDHGSNGKLWHVSGTIIIVSDQFLLFAQRFVDLLALLGFRASGELEPGQHVTDHDPRPADHDVLSQAATRALALIGPFATPSKRIVPITVAKSPATGQGSSSPRDVVDDVHRSSSVQRLR